MARITQAQRACAFEILERLGGAINAIATGLADSNSDTIDNATPLLVEALNNLLTDWTANIEDRSRRNLAVACSDFMDCR